MNDNLPLVSVVVPLYNYEDFIGETLESILASDYGNVEIVIMNDGSTDNSYEVAAAYAEKHPSIRLFSRTNGGLSVARNSAIERAGGKYIFPVDADDLISPQFISLAVKELENDPELKVVAPSAEFIGKRQGPWKLPPFSVSLLARRNIVAACAMYRKTDWARIGGYLPDTAREDWCFWIAMFKDGGKFMRLDHIGLYYRIHDVSLRTSERYRVRETIDKLNALHPEFFERELKGPLRYSRSWSKTLNTIDLILGRRKK